MKIDFIISMWIIILNFEHESVNHKNQIKIILYNFKVDFKTKFEM